LIEPIYEWFLGMLEEDDPETGRLVRRIGEDILANKPISPLGGSVRNLSNDERMNAFLSGKGMIDRLTTPGENYKWQNIGKPLFGPAIELGLFFTPMNPVVRRLLRGIYTAADISETNY